MLKELAPGLVDVYIHFSFARVFVLARPKRGRDYLGNCTGPYSSLHSAVIGPCLYSHDMGLLVSTLDDSCVTLHRFHIAVPRRSNGTLRNGWHPYLGYSSADNDKKVSATSQHVCYNTLNW